MVLSQMTNFRNEGDSLVNRLIKDVRKSLNHECYFSALSLALTLPDICGIAEFSITHPVANRYIDWCETYVCEGEGKRVRLDDKIETPYLSGEVIYNLRNTYLHQGCPNLNKSKIKNEINQIDNFTLILGNAKKLYDVSMNIDFGNGLVNVRSYFIDVTYLCNLLCDAAEHYFKMNTDKFQMDYTVIEENELFRDK